LGSLTSTEQGRKEQEDGEGKKLPLPLRHCFHQCRSHKYQLTNPLPFVLVWLVIEKAESKTMELTP
jgi:hypothetical protein